MGSAIKPDYNLALFGFKRFANCYKIVWKTRLIPQWVNKVVPRSYLEAQNDGPDKAEGEAVVAVDDIVRPHVLQVNPLLFEELQRLVHILQAVDPHSAPGRTGLRKGKKILKII